LDVSF